MASLSVPERHEFPLSATLGGVTAALKCSALRYPVSAGGMTLILLHGVSGHKEQYHTAITRLLSLRNVAINTYDIREIWSIDFPNHGEAATLNRPLLDEFKANNGKDNGTCTTMDIAVYLHAFLSLPHFRGHNIVGMGHSGGCTVWVRALTMLAPLYPSALILLEPTLMFPFMSPTDPRSIHGAANVRGARAKRDTWSSRAEFRQWLMTNRRSVWSRWDPRVLDLYVEYALEEVMSPEGHVSYITPKLRKDEEAAIYSCQAHTIEPSQLAAMCKALNEAGRRGVHIIWAELEEFVSKMAKAEILDASEHRIKTQRTIVGSGHLVPQLNPDALADAMHEVLGLIGSGARALL